MPRISQGQYAASGEAAGQAVKKHTFGKQEAIIKSKEWGAGDEQPWQRSWSTLTVHILWGTDGAVRVMPAPNRSTLLDRRKMLAKALSCVNSTEPTVKTGIDDNSHVSSPEQRKHAKA